MAVDTTQSWQEHTSDGSTAYFSFNFNYDTTRPGTIAVGKRTADNTYSVVDASDYELIPNASGDGGQIRFIQNPSGSQVIDDIPPAGTIVRIERISVDTSSATWQIGLDMSELVNLFDRLFRLVQENKGGFDNVIKTFETQHDVSLYEMLATHDNRLFFWDNTNKTITPTDFPKEDVVRCVNGLFFRVSVNQSGIKYLEWSENGSSDWKGIDISSVNALAQDAHDIATQATNAINTHIADTNNPHSVTKAQVGLGNVDNTSDANKPISTATQTALNAKQDTISDLATIRTGASKGATAVQPGDLATVATSGNYNDLSNKPTIGDGIITIKQSGTIKGTFTTNQTGNTEIDLDAGGTGTVFSVNGQTGTVVLTASDVGAATSAQGAKADTAVQPGDLATVATSGAYSDLIGTPTIPAAQVNSDWNANSGVAQILNKPTIPTVNNSTITITQGGTTKGSFTLNQATGDTIALDAGGSDLPDQTGQSGKFLTTDGTDASWSDKPLVNTATGTNSLSLIGTGTTNTASVNIGPNSESQSNYSIAIGSSAKSSGAISIGTLSYSAQSGVAIGYDCSSSYPHGIAIGYSARASANYAIQLSTGASRRINSDANTFKVGNANGNFEIMSADGTIPTDRFTTTPVADGSYVPTLTISNGTATRSWQSSDYVVDFQAPTAGNNYTWYRKYASGWVEQGGIVLDSESGNYTVNLPVAMADTNYDIQLTCKQDANGALAYYMNQTTTSFVREATNRGGTTAGRETKWRVEGMAAS